MWSTTKMAQTLQQLIDTYGCQLVFNAMGIEKKILAEIKQLTARDSFWFDEVEAPSLGDLSALIKNCHFFFGNEGGPRHIAHALDVPSLAIFPPGTSAAKWLPDPDDSQQAISASPSAAGSDWLSVDEVWDRLVSFLDLHLPQKALSNN